MQQSLKKILSASILIAIIIFFTALISDFSVKMFYSSPEPSVKISASLIAIGLITALFFLLLLAVPKLQEPIFRMFGLNL